MCIVYVPRYLFCLTKSIFYYLKTERGVVRMLKVVKLMIKLFNRTVGGDIFSIWCFISTLDIKILENIKP